MPRGLWKGAISFGLVNVPVELFAAEKRSTELDLTMLDKRDLAPVGYKRYNKASGKDVDWADVVKVEEITEPEKEGRERGGAQVIDLMALLKKSVERKRQKRLKAKKRAA